MEEPRIFISYRRDDTLLWPELISNELRRRNTPATVFIDRSATLLGEDFEERCLAEAARAHVLLALIGQEWPAERSSGQRRIDDENDLLRREILSGKTGNATVIPVLLDGTGWDDLAPLPQALAFLRRANAQMLDRNHPERGVSELVGGLMAAGHVTTALVSNGGSAPRSSAVTVVNINLNGTR